MAAGGSFFPGFSAAMASVVAQRGDARRILQGKAHHPGRVADSLIQEIPAGIGPGVETENAIFPESAVTDRDDPALLGLLPNRVRDDDPSGGFLLLHAPDKHPIMQGLELQTITP